MLNELISMFVPLVPRKIVHRVARRYIAGENKRDGIGMIQALETMGFVTTVDILGEDTESFEQAQAAANEYIDLMETMAEAKVERNVSLKLTQLGLRLDENRAFDELRRILEAAAQHGFFVRLDMEDSTLTDVTFDFYKRARVIWPHVGTVLQARLHRTVDDARRLAESGANFRLCKGIYKENKTIAYTGREEIRESYLETARVLMDAGAYVGMATHDLPLIERLRQDIDARPEARERVEFQALLGVPIRSPLEEIRQAGFKVRIYVPYGAQWYAYSMRRLKENPDMAAAITKSLFSTDHIQAGAA